MADLSAPSLATGIVAGGYSDRQTSEARVLLSSSSQCAAVVGIVLIVGATIPGYGYTRLLARATLFTALASAFLLRSGGHATTVLLRQLLLQSVFGSVSFALIAVALGHRAWVLRPECVLIAYLAACEEAVYRFLLPLRLYCDLLRLQLRSRQSVFVAVVLAQLTFAISHLDGNAPSSWTSLCYSVAWFMVGGLVFAILTIGAGLWSAIAVHAAFNLELQIRDTSALFLPPLGVLLGLLLLLLLLLGFFASTAFTSFADGFAPRFPPRRTYA